MMSISPFPANCSHFHPVPVFLYPLISGTGSTGQDLGVDIAMTLTVTNLFPQNESSPPTEAAHIIIMIRLGLRELCQCNFRHFEVT